MEPRHDGMEHLVFIAFGVCTMIYEHQSNEQGTSPYSHSKSMVVNFWSVMAFRFCVRATSFRWVCHKSTLILYIVSPILFCLSQYWLWTVHVVPTTLNVNLTLLSFLVKQMNKIDLQHCKDCHLLSGFFIKILIIHDNKSL